MTATYTFDIFSTLDGFGSHHGDWGGYWGKQGPELLDRRLAVYSAEQRMVFGANTYRQFVQILGLGTAESGVGDPWVKRMTSLPATVLSSTLEGPLDWPDATVVSGDAVRHRRPAQAGVRGAVAFARQPVDQSCADGRRPGHRVQVTLFPVITGKTGEEPIFGGADDFDLELIESRTLDGNTQELIYRPTLHA